MSVNSVSSPAFATSFAANGWPANRPEQGMSFLDILAATQDDSAETGADEDSAKATIDFSNATRQELFDWMNERIRSGKMTLDESAAFLAMTVQFDLQTLKPVDMATDTTRVDFLEKAQTGIEWARYNYDEADEARWRTTLATMEKLQAVAQGIE